MAIKQILSKLNERRINEEIDMSFIDPEKRVYILKVAAKMLNAKNFSIIEKGGSNLGRDDETTSQMFLSDLGKVEISAVNAEDIQLNSFYLTFQYEVIAKSRKFQTYFAIGGNVNINKAEDLYLGFGEDDLARILPKLRRDALAALGNDIRSERWPEAYYTKMDYDVTKSNNSKYVITYMEKHKGDLVSAI